MMTSLETTPTTLESYHLPQHTQLYHDHQQHPRTLEADDNNNNDSNNDNDNDIIIDPTTTTPPSPPPTPPPESYSCIPPSAQIKSYFNPLTNKTQYLPIEVKIHEIGILFNYEIRHADDVKWEKGEEDDEDGLLGDLLEGAKESISGFYEKGKDFLGGLFGGDDDEEDEDEENEESESGQEGEEPEDANDNSSSQSNESNNNDDGEQNLLSVERRMVSEIWKALLEDEKMTWDLGSKMCAGLVIEDDGIQRRLLSDGAAANGTATSVVVEEGVYASDVIDVIDVEGEDDNNSVTGEEEEGNSDMEGEGVSENDNGTEVVGDGNNATQLEGAGVEDILDTVDNSSAGEEDILDTVDTKFTTFSGTKLLGMTYRPLDYVNPDGCLVPDTTCTAIRGRVSAAYSGTDEYGVVRTVVERLRSGMGTRSFLPPDGPALNVEFTSAGGTAPSGGNGQIISLNTDRG
eukprot:CAMPEP_0196137146 /NCGR_PEP_ID=MMETSP0910-20130528/5226_1 /TAXON_ID=49265 /ORGANISM="Thalassiosira rotula, Strain GSO102" /LENGTH=459 /DNA_ID=CAMNT_0041397567 /DNA_START=20 /DNA_END=1395 /DNA_ORIENTATION=+